MNHKTCRAGVTLVEVVLALLILGLAMLPMFGLMSYSNMQTKVQKAEVVAANLAKEEMNRWLAVMNKSQFSTAQQSWKWGNDHNVEGNFFKGTVWLFLHGNGSTNVTIPIPDWHDPRGCPNSRETQGVTFTSPSVPISQAANGDPNPGLADIKLQVWWRLGNEQYSDVRSLTLVSRRAFIQ